ncbi:MAG: acyl-CoA thioesterase [Verrucomicrobia bacterium]|nr:acyl-CoA thioesterase [Verrucomicrobiota bacterium]
MPFQFKVTRRVEFSDTDMAGLMHYSNYFRFMETAEHAFYRSMGFSVVLKNLNPPLGFPRVHAECDFKRPLRFEDMVEIELLVQEKKSKSVSYCFRFRNLSASPVEEVARGLVTVVCVAHGPNGKLAAVPIPEMIANQIDVAPAELLA